MRLFTGSSLIFSVFFLSSFYSRAQAPGNDSLLVERSKQAAISLYNQATHDILPLYNGSEFVNTNYTVAYNPFYASVELTPGNIWYDGTEYRNVPLIYDILTDEVVINYQGMNYKIRLSLQ